ncbi:MAG: tail fiber protein [Pseudomonadota bacterium]|nr:tail fiber protein [Pseudomonadota bacterium]
MDPILGQIILWPVPWVPAGWALCDGRLLEVGQYQALYSLIGNLYGGTAPNTFALPDLRNKFVLPTQVMNYPGQQGGAPTCSVTATGSGSAMLSLNNLPTHSHLANFTPSGGGGSTDVSVAIPAVSATTATTDIPGTGVSLAKTTGPAADIYSTASPDTTLAPFTVQVPTSAGGGTVAIGNTGNGTAFPIEVEVPVTVATVPPYITMNYIIAVEGVYPPRP